MSKKRRVVKVVLISIVGVVLVGLIGASLYFYQYAFVPSKKSFLSNGDSAFDRNAKQWLKQAAKQEWTMQSATGNLKLVAAYVPAKTPTTKTVVVAHGYMNTKEDMAPQIKLFHEAGYNVLAPDDRGHGQSQGNYIGYGWPDRLDYLKWMKRLVKVQGPSSQIALYGVSMGGATVMYLSGEKLPKQVQVIVEDCGYTSIIDELSYQAKSMFNLPKWPLVPAVGVTASILARYNVFAADATKAVAKNTRPMLFIHGDKDRFVPTAMGKTNYQAAGGEKSLWIVPGAAHANSYKKHPQAYAKRVLGFLAQHGM